MHPLSLIHIYAVARELDTGAAAIALPVLHPLAAAPAVGAEQGDTLSLIHI